MLKRPTKNDPLLGLFDGEASNVKLEAWKIHHRTKRIGYLVVFAVALLPKWQLWHWFG